MGGLLAAVPLAVVGTYFLQEFQSKVRWQTFELQMAVADDVGRAVDAAFVDAQNGLDAVGRVLTDPEMPREATERVAIQLVAGNEALDHVAIYDADGGLIDVISEGGLRQGAVERLDDAIRIEAERSNVATGTAESAPDGLRVRVTIPLRVGERTTGFVSTRLSLRPVQQRVERLTEVRFDRSPDSLFIVDSAQRLVAHGNAARARERRDVSDAGILAGIDPGVISGRFQQSGEYRDHGRTMVGTIVGLQTRPWAVVVQLPAQTVYATYLSVRRVVYTTLTLVILLALLAAFIVARQITRPIAELSRFARDLSERRFDRRITLQTRDEFSVLGDAMSAAAADLEASEQRIRQEEAIRGDLGRYLPADLVEQVVAREQDMALGGKRREITVLFADVVAFTPLTEQLAAEEVVALLNELFTILTEIVFRHGGTIDKFIGDCVMAVWGAHKSQDDHAARALAAAEDMMSWLETGNVGWEKKYGARIQLAIGVHTGEAIVGNVGSETRMELTAIGETVNIAARLESIARPSQILITEQTRAAAGEAFEVQDLGARRLVGTTHEVHLFEVVT